MPYKSAKSSPSQNTAVSAMDYETLLRLVSARVWALWQDDLRRSRERGGKIVRR